jgi:ribosomal protein S18 acetylase RimI-like enzyme
MPASSGGLLSCSAMKGKRRASLQLVTATEREVDEVFAIYRACIEAMLARGIQQWDERYPTRATAAEAAQREDLYLLAEAEGRTEGRIVGSVILNAIAAPEYAPVVWQYGEPALIIHTLVIDPRHQGGGLGSSAMAACEEFARQRGFCSVRLDAFPGNPAAISLYQRLGYALRGEVRFGNKPPGHERYAVYEKRL